MAAPTAGNDTPSRLLINYFNSQLLIQQPHVNEGFANRQRSIFRNGPFITNLLEIWGRQ
jgi:hypothetical protein